jgi:CBS domain-containing protein
VTDLIVKDVMVPLEEYATVDEEATLYDAVMALEKVQQVFDRSIHKYLHRAVLVLDKDKKVVGKISQLDVLRALEPKYREIGDPGKLSRTGFSPQFMKSMLQQFALWDRPLSQICSKGAKIKVKEFMYTPTEGEYIDEKASLGEAIHQLVMGHHQSLLVTGEKSIVGILRLTDVFMTVFEEMRACLPEAEQ